MKGVTEGDESEVLVAQVQPAAGRRGGEVAFLETCRSTLG